MPVVAASCERLVTFSSEVVVTAVMGVKSEGIKYFVCAGVDLSEPGPDWVPLPLLRY